MELSETRARGGNAETRALPSLDRSRQASSGLRVPVLMRSGKLTETWQLSHIAIALPPRMKDV
jgi:hypothetical protein